MDLRSKFVILMALAVLLTVSGADAMSANFGSELVVEPQIVVPNQRVTLTGRGFTSLVVPDGNGPMRKEFRL